MSYAELDQQRRLFLLCSPTTPGRELGTLNEPLELGNILGFMLPFFIASSAGNADLARAAIKELIDAYQAATPTELDLVGRIIGFSVASMDNLRLSMAPNLPPAQVLRYRSNAVTLSRSSDQALKILEAVQAKREQSRKIPRPSIATAPPPPVRPAPSIVSAPLPRPAVAKDAGPRNAHVPEVPAIDLETMKRDARFLMAAFSRNDTQASTTIPAILDPAASASAAARAAIATATRASPK